jgi:hypothetical protein
MLSIRLLEIQFDDPGRSRRRRKRPYTVEKRWNPVKTAAKRRRNPSSQKCIENTEKNDGRFLAKNNGP